MILRSLLIIATPYHIKTEAHANMGWLRLVGSLKIQVSFAKEPYERDDISHPFHRNKGVSVRYGVASLSRLLQIIGLFCKRAL